LPLKTYAVPDLKKRFSLKSYFFGARNNFLTLELGTAMTI
jgi:hypothetical protein